MESSFLWKNLLNTLSALGEVFPHLAQHLITNKDDPQNGPGATAYFKLRTSDIDEMTFRSNLIEDMRRM